MYVILASFRPKQPLLEQSNKQLVERCHAYKLSRKPYLAKPNDLKQSLYRAASLIGDVPIREALEEDLLLALANVPLKSRFDVVRAINELLIYAKRPFRLPNPRPPRPDEVSFITLEALIPHLPKFPYPYDLVVASLFATGCRWGELPKAKIGETSAHISCQLDRQGTVRLTKNKKARTAPLIPPLISLTLAYRALGDEMRGTLRAKHQERVYRAVKSILGVRVHDLRHSYAVAWGSRGFSTAEIARYIGDTEEVCARHYRNYCATPDEINRAQDRWKATDP